MGISKWIKKHVAAISLATAKIEKDSLGQRSVELDSTTGMYQNINKGTLADSLVNGEITQETMDLRWRMYRVLEASNDLDVEVLNLSDDEDSPLKTNVNKISQHRNILKDVILDPEDDYPAEIVISSTKVCLSALDVLERGEIVANEDIGDDITSIGSINSNDYHSAIKADNILEVDRELYSRFMLEDYTKKLIIRTINDNEKLVEFYVSKYPDEYVRKSHLFLSEVKKLIKNPRNSDTLDISKISFIAYKCPGARDFHRYEYDVKSFDKIIEFDGNYIFKFKCDVRVNGEYLLEKYRSTELDKRYDNKERKL